MKSKDCSKTLLLFDFGTVLTGLSKQRCIEALQKIGCGRIAYYVDECRQEDLFHELEIGGSIQSFCNEARRQSAYTDEMGIFHPCTATDDQIIWAWNELLTGIPVEKLRMIRHLHDDLGYRTAILSNTNKIHWDKALAEYFTADGLRMEDYFDEVFTSFIMGKVKPDDDIYQEVRQKVAGTVDRIIFIDDSEKNCRAAQRNGIQAFHDANGDRWLSAIVPLLEGNGRAAVIGNFDGVHKGHQSVIRHLRGLAAERHLMPIALTFDCHPRSIFKTDFHPEYLTTLDERLALLRSALQPTEADGNAGDVHLLHFTKEFADIPARQFMEEVLRDQLNVRLLLLGYDNHFGKYNPDEHFETYRQYGAELGIEVLMSVPLDVNSVRVSSSHIRNLVKSGRMEEVNACLGYSYSISGTVVHGYEEGRKLGYPTANILPPAGKLMPPNGVYESEVVIEGETKVRKGMTNIGTRPTYNGENVTIETNILGFIGNIYGKHITVRLLRMIRQEIAFDSPEALREQIEKDRNSIQ